MSMCGAGSGLVKSARTLPPQFSAVAERIRWRFEHSVLSLQRDGRTEQARLPRAGEAKGEERRLDTKKTHNDHHSHHSPQIKGSE